jgi:putative colanic acid biosysnthesis UDP-glucose lipid carrier transferase
MQLTTVRDIPVFSFFTRLIDPLVILGTLFVLTRLQGEPFSGHYLVLAIIAFFVSSYLHEQIDSHHNWRGGGLRSLGRGVFFGWVLFVAIMVLIGYATGYSYLYPQRVIAIWFVATPFILLGGHLALRKSAERMHSAGQPRSVVIVGLNETGVTLAKRIALAPHRMMEVRGFFDDRGEERHAQPAHPGSRLSFLGKMADVPAYVREQGINVIFVSQSMSAQPRSRQLLDELQDTTASIYLLPDMANFDLMQARFDEVAGMPVVAIRETPFSGINSLVKRISDIVLACFSLVALSPIMLTIAAMVKFTSKGPVIFRQRRYGLNGEEIIVYKFRSMAVCEDGDRVTQARKDDMRVTRLGAVLRRTSLDELPQFLNVLTGSMSIVGPRPHAVAHNEQYRGLIKGYMLRHKVKPGITGWAQVNGLRGETDTLDKMAARIEYDLDYLRNWSLWLDLWIVVRTVKVVLGRDKNAY